LQKISKHEKLTKRKQQKLEKGKFVKQKKICKKKKKIGRNSKNKKLPEIFKI